MRASSFTARSVAACAILAAITAPVSADPLAEIEDAQQALYDRVSRAVVYLRNGSSAGSGFFAAPGTILTNRHVVGDAETIEVVLRDGRKLVGQVVERAGHDIDLALVRVAVRDVAPLPLAPADPRVGTWIASVGHGVDSPWTFTTGMVSNVYRNRAGLPVLQTQIPLNPGSSGSPIVDRHGRVVGVVASGITAANAVNFAIGARVAARELRGLASASLVIRAPAGTPVFIDGQVAGTGPSLTVELAAGEHRITAIIGGALHERTLTCPCPDPVDLR